MNNWRNSAISIVMRGTLSFGELETQYPAMRLGRFGVSRQIVVKLAGEVLSRGMDLCDDVVVPNG